MEFDEYLDGHYDRLARFAAVLTGETPSAEDVLQIVLTRAWQQWDRVSATAYPHAYVRRMIVNEYLTQRRRWGRVVPVAQFDDLVPASPDHADGHAQSVELLGLVAKLPPKQRAAIVLRFYEDLPDCDIAAALGCSEVTVRSNITRALVALRMTSANAMHEETAR